MLRSKSAFIGILIVLVAMTGFFTATSAGMVDRETVGAIGSGDGDVVAFVNGDAIHRNDFVAQVLSVEQNVLMFQAQAQTNPDPLLLRIVEILDATASEDIALASLILDASTYQEAAREGYLPDPDAVAEQIEQERLMFELIEESPEEFGFAQEDIDSFRAYIESFGEDEYWNEHYPQMIEQQVAVNQFQQAMVNAGEDWIEVQRDIFNRADVEIVAEEFIAPATVSGAAEYLEQVWALDTGAAPAQP